MHTLPIPPLPKGIKGTSAIDRPHVTLTPEQARPIIDEVPERTKISRKPIRTMMEAVWDTGLRAYGLFRLEKPRHYARPGELSITADIDKEGFARTLQLRPETCKRIAALGDGLLFGKFSYLKPLRKAAHRTRGVTGLTAYECNHVDLRDFRHAAATAFWHQSNSLAAVAFMLGHKQETTTVRYLDLHENVYTEAIDKRFSVAELVAVGDGVSGTAPNAAQSLPNVTGTHAAAPARM
jgi:integrase